MKRLNYFIFTAFCMLFICACSSFDDEKMSEEDILKGLIAGEWSYTSDNNIFMLSFSPDGTGSSSIHSYSNSEWKSTTVPTQYSLSGNQMKLQLHSEPYFDGTIEVADSVIILVEKSGSKVVFSKYDGQDATLDKMKQEIEKKYAVPYKAVDLGLPSGTKWANVNVGADKPEDMGDFYAWGEVEPKSFYSWSNYLTYWGQTLSHDDCGTDKDPLRDYVFPNTKSIAGTKYDVAHVKWGGKWKMPTYEQAEELLYGTYVTNEWTSMNGVNGCKFTSKKNGNFIFLPGVGGKLIDYDYNDSKSCCYWTASSSLHYNDFAAFLLSYLGLIYTNEFERSTGFPVRPVLSE